MPPSIWKIRYLRLVRKVHRAMRHRRLRKWEWWQSIRAKLLDRRLWKPCRDTVAGGMSLGLFFAMMPMPLQTVATAAIATRAKVNIPFAVACCFVTNPFTEPFIRVAQFKWGGWLRENLEVTIPRFGQLSMPPNVADFIIGFLTMGIFLAFLAYPLVHLFSALLPEHLPVTTKKLKGRHEGSAS